MRAVLRHGCGLRFYFLQDSSVLPGTAGLETFCFILEIPDRTDFKMRDLRATGEVFVLPSANPPRLPEAVTARLPGASPIGQVPIREESPIGSIPPQ